MSKKIIFMGTPIFAAQILKALIGAGYEVGLVVSQPDKKVGRKQRVMPTPVKELALENDIDVFQPTNIKNDYQAIIDYQADLIITAAYGQIVPDEVIQAPRIKCINVHGSLLPKYRGGAPIHYSVLNGDQQTGVTIMEMVAKMDAGSIISQSSFAIDGDDTTQIVHDKMIDVASQLLLATLPSIFDGSYTLTPQDERLVTYSPNISKEQERIDWHRPAQDVHNQIRGLNSWPGSYSMLDGKRFKIYLSKLTKNPATGECATIANIDKQMIYVNCQDFQIGLLRVQPAGKKQMECSQFIAGIDVLSYVGKRFE